MAQDALPSHMRALVIQEKGRAVVTEIPVPSIDDDEILVRNVAIAQNPTDWKCMFSISASDIPSLIVEQILIMSGILVALVVAIGPGMLYPLERVSQHLPLGTTSLDSHKEGHTPTGAHLRNTSRSLPISRGKCPRGRSHMRKPPLLDAGGSKSFWIAPDYLTVKSLDFGLRFKHYSIRQD